MIYGAVRNPSLPAYPTAGTDILQKKCLQIFGFKISLWDQLTSRRCVPLVWETRIDQEESTIIICLILPELNNENRESRNYKCLQYLDSETPVVYRLLGKPVTHVLGFWRHVHSPVDVNVSKKHAVSVFRNEVRLESGHNNDYARREPSNQGQGMRRRWPGPSDSPREVH